jgi:hypothetical protein
MTLPFAIRALKSDSMLIPFLHGCKGDTGIPYIPCHGICAKPSTA